MKSELRKILNGDLLDEGSKVYKLVETDKAIDAILELFNKQLPEEKESYQDDNPQEVGENQFYGLGLADIKSRIEE